jgi:hydrogenase expression/formation protein HypC
MCLAYPMTITDIDGTYANVEADGVRRKVGLALVPEAKVGDDVLIHAGYAINIVDAEEAEETRQLFKKIWAAEEEERAALDSDTETPS